MKIRGGGGGAMGWEGKYHTFKIGVMFVINAALETWPKRTVTAHAFWLQEGYSN